MIDYQFTYISFIAFFSFFRVCSYFVLLIIKIIRKRFQTFMTLRLANTLIKIGKQISSKAQNSENTNNLFWKILVEIFLFLLVVYPSILVKMVFKFPSIFVQTIKKDNSVISTYGSFALHLVEFLYSQETVDAVFKPIVGDWHEEYFEALFRKQIWKSKWINFRYIYTFIMALWQKSPIGDLIEFVRKIAS